MTEAITFDWYCFCFLTVKNIHSQFTALLFVNRRVCSPNVFLCLHTFGQFCCQMYCLTSDKGISLILILRDLDWWGTHLKGFLYQSLFLLPIFNGLANSYDSVSGFTFWLDYHYSIFFHTAAFHHGDALSWTLTLTLLAVRSESVGNDGEEWEKKSLIGSSETSRKDVWDWWRSMEEKPDTVAHAKNCLEGKRVKKRQWSRGRTGANKRKQKRAEDIIIATNWTTCEIIYQSVCAKMKNCMKPFLKPAHFKSENYGTQIFYILQLFTCASKVW